MRLRNSLEKEKFMKKITYTLSTIIAVSSFAATSFAGENKEAFDPLVAKTLKTQQTIGGLETAAGQVVSSYTAVKKYMLEKNTTQQLESLQKKLLSVEAIATQSNLHPLAIGSTEVQIIQLQVELRRLRDIPALEQNLMHSAEFSIMNEKIDELRKLLAAQKDVLKLNENFANLRSLHAATTEKKAISELSKKLLGNREQFSALNPLEKNRSSYRNFSRLGALSNLLAIDGISRLGAAYFLNKDVGLTALDDLGAGVYDAVEKQIKPRAPAQETTQGLSSEEPSVK